MLARPQGAEISGVGNVVVRAQSYSPAVGAKAPASRTPTLSTTGGRLAPLTTATHPDRQLYTTSVAQALAAHAPFVVTFATPKFCTSRTCGPVVDVVSHVRKQSSPARPCASSTSRCSRATIRRRATTAGCAQWGLQSEPWVFLVGRDGRIKAKFEGPVSVGELRAAVESLLVA